MNPNLAIDEPDPILGIEDDESELEPLADGIEMPRESPNAAGEMSLAVMEILPPNFPLPILAKFVPNPALREHAHDAATHALAVRVEGQEGLTIADRALETLRTAQAVITEHFKEPADIAFQLHRAITQTRAEWLAEGEQARLGLGARMDIELRRLRAVADEQRRQAQAEADRQAREAAAREAAAAQQAGAPLHVVQELEREAEQATAPPIPRAGFGMPKLASSTPVEKWKARIAGTPGDQDPHPKMADLTNRQRAQVLQLLKAVINGQAPMVCFELNWTALDARAKAERSALALPGMEAYDEGGLRAKGLRKA